MTRCDVKGCSTISEKYIVLTKTYLCLSCYNEVKEEFQITNKKDDEVERE